MTGVDIRSWRWALAFSGEARVKDEFITFKPKRAFPLHVGRVDHVAVRRLAVGGRCAMQIEQLVRHEFKGFTILSVVVKERLLRSRGL